MFDREKFWAVIEESRDASMHGQFGFHDEWQAAISQLTDQELAEAAAAVQEQCRRAARPQIFEAYMLHTTKGEDHGFARYCEWLLSHGRVAFEAALEHTDSLVGTTKPRCRWQDPNLYQSVLMFIGIRSRFRPTVAIAQFQQTELKDPQLVLSRSLAELLAPELISEISQLQTPRAVDDLLRVHMGADLEAIRLKLPYLYAAQQTAASGHVNLDRRSSMNTDKFWHVLEICVQLGGTPTNLRSVLGLLPSQQVAQFHELLQACLSNACGSALSERIADHPLPECWLFALAMLGRYAYQLSVGSGIPAADVAAVDPEFLRAATVVFCSQTGMELPPLAIPLQSRKRAA